MTRRCAAEPALAPSATRALSTGCRRAGVVVAAATRTARCILLAAVLPVGASAQDGRRIALLRGVTGVEPEPGSLLAGPARLEVARLPLADALARLSQRAGVQVAFSPSLLPVGHRVACECGDLNMAGALDRLLADTDLGYVELGPQIVVVPKATPEVPQPDGSARGLVHTTATLTGVARDSVDLEPVASAHVTVTPVGGETEAVAGVSDRFGAFVVPGVPASGPVSVDVAVFGRGWTRSYDAPPSAPIRALLTPVPIGLEGVQVTGQGRVRDPLSFSRDGFVVDSALVRGLPPTIETDVLRATAAAPSASAPSDYSSVPLVRGGTSDGTPVLLDGVRLFNPFHLGGLVSAISPEVVERTTVLAGPGPDLLAIGSLSGAIDIATRDGSRDRRRTAGSLGLVSARFVAEGPVGENGSHLVAVRRTWLDGATLALTGLGVVEERFPYSFGDLFGKVTADRGGVRRLSVSAYLNSESLELADTTSIGTWDGNEEGRLAGNAGRSSGMEIRETTLTLDNIALSGHYRDRLGSSGIVDATLGHSRFGSDLVYREQTLENPDAEVVGDGLMSETRADLRATWRPGRTTIVVGTQAVRFRGRHVYDPGPLRYGRHDREGFGYLLRPLAEGFRDLLLPLAVRASHLRLAVHSSVDTPLRRGFRTRAGLRVDRFVGLATTLAPFAELRYAASWWSARISAWRSHQALASMRDGEALDASQFAYDLLLPVREPPVPRNTELAIGWEGVRGGSRIRVDAYARTLDHLRLPHPETRPGAGSVLQDPGEWERASGSAHGIETSWSWLGRRVSVLGSYRLARASRRVGSRVYTPRFHRDQEFEIGSAYNHGASSWSARISLRSGQPYTPWLAAVPGTQYENGWDTQVLLGGGYNSERLPHYARVDVGWRREGAVAPYVSVVNLFNRPNVAGRLPPIHGGRDNDGDVWIGWARNSYRTQLRIVPSIGVEIRF